MVSLGRYELRDLLGQGGFARVYRAWDPALQRDVALKTLLPHLADDPEVRQRFLAEARRVAGLRHPHIVVVLDVGEAEGRPFFAMELVDGGSLADLLDGGHRLPLGQVAGIVRDLCSAVEYLHEAGLIHRDIKPANVMMDQSGRVVLMDFGIARALAGTAYTRGSAILGTPEAMAPEQIRGEPVGPAADIYALGILAYQLLSGRPPFEGDTARVLYQHAYEPPPPLRDLCPGLPEPVYAVVEACLAKDPARRPAKASLLAEVLVEAAGGTVARPPAALRPRTAAVAPPPVLEPTLPLTGTAAGAPVSGSREPPLPPAMPGAIAAESAPRTGGMAARGLLRRRRWLPPAIGAAMVAMLVTGGVLLTRRSQESPRPGTESAVLPSAPAARCDGVPAGRLAAGCAPVPVTLTAAGEKVRVPFDGAKGQRLSLGITQVKLGDAGAEISVLSPDDSTLASTTTSTDGRDLDLRPLPVTGTYAVVMTAKSGGSLMLTLSGEKKGPIVVGGAPVPVEIERPGQNARLSFEGEKGQRLSLAVSRVRLEGPNCCSAAVTVIAPETVTSEGKTLVSDSAGSDGRLLRPDPLPLSGTYTILLNPGIFTGSMTVTLSEEESGSITIGGPPVTVEIERIGKIVRLTFEGSRGQRPGLGITQVSFGDAYPRVQVVGGDDRELGSASPSRDGAGLVVGPLPVAGTYALVVNPGIATGHLTLTLSAETGGALVPDGGPAEAVIDRPGQSARFTFAGRRGQQLGLAVTRVQFGDGFPKVSVLGPDDTELASVSAGKDGKALAIGPLPADGTFGVVVAPGVATGTLQLTLSTEVTSGLKTDGQPSALVIERPGQRGRLSFEGRKGQQVALSLGRVTFETGCCTPVAVTVLTPEGTELTTARVLKEGKTLDAVTLPADGTYGVLVEPGLLTGSMSVTLRSTTP